MTKRLIGKYVSIEEAMMAVERLHDQGYGRHDIHVIADRTVRDAIPFTMNAEVTSVEEAREAAREDHRSLWEKIKDAFTFGEYHEEDHVDITRDLADDPFSEYRNDLAAGKVIVLLDEDDDYDVSSQDPLLTDEAARAGLNVNGGTDLVVDDPHAASPLEDEDPTIENYDLP